MQTHSRSSRSAIESLDADNESNEHTSSYQHPPTETNFNDTEDRALQPQPSPVEALRPYDIICGRNKLAFNNIGNRRFRVTVQLSMDRYMAATTRSETSKVIEHVANLVGENGGRFLRLSPGGKHWIELDKRHVHEKVGHALRDAAPAKRKSDSTANANFPYNPPYDASATPHFQQDSDNVLNTAFRFPSTHRRPSQRQKLRVSTVDELVLSSRPDGVAMLDSKGKAPILQPLGNKEEDSKTPAIQLQAKQKSAMNPTQSSKNTPPEWYEIHRTPEDSSKLSPRQLLSPSILDQWITTSHSDGVTTLISTERATIQQPHGDQDEIEKAPAMQSQERQAHHVTSRKRTPSLSPKESRKFTQSSTSEASITCSIDREHETFDHSSFGNDYDALLDWQSDETALE